MRSRGILTGAVALAVHVAAFALVGATALRAPSLATLATANARPGEAEVNLELPEPAATSAGAQVVGGHQERPAAAGTERPARGGLTGLPAPTGSSEARSTDVAPPQAVGSTPPLGPWSFSPTTAPVASIDLRVPAGTITLDPREREQARPRPTVERPEGLEEALATRDADLGLGKAAPLVAALRRSALARADIDGSAVLHLELDEGGRVRSIRVVRATGDARGWQAVADAAGAGALAAGLAGASVDVRVQVATVAPSREQTHPVDLCTSPDEGDCRGQTWATADLAARATRTLAVAILRIARGGR